MDMFLPVIYNKSALIKRVESLLRHREVRRLIEENKHIDWVIDIDYWKTLKGKDELAYLAKKDADLKRLNRNQKRIDKLLEL
jgi:hypothetical protein